MESLSIESIPDSFIEQCFDKGLSAFFIRKPEDKNIIFGAAEKTKKGLHEGCFIVAPFSNPLDIISFPSEMRMEEILRYNGSSKSSRSSHPFPKKSTSKESHLNNVITIRDSIISNGYGKTVLSRVKIKEGPIPFTQFFKRLCIAYPDATIFWFYSPETSLYCGATPELLLSAKGGNINTMSLAGTRIRGAEEPWDIKNIEEQQIVTDFIIDILKSENITTRSIGPYTKSAGKIEHLCTEIETVSPQPQITLEKLKHILSRLSPTPALSGFPKAEAIGLINQTEEHSRGYYGGYLGIFKSILDFNFYVNLRSLRHENGRTALFAGGGITQLSYPEEEWNETENKISTLLHILE